MKTLRRKKTRLNPTHALLENGYPGCPRKQRLAYGLKVWLMTDEQLRKEAEKKIWLSAFAGNNPRSDYHWHVDFIYDECVRRDAVDKIYQAAYDAVAKTV